MSLVTPEDLRRLTGDETATDDNVQALETCRLAEEAVLDFLELDELPFDVSLRDERRVKRIALVVAKRNWVNPDQLSSEGSVGPIGGDTFSEDMRGGYDLTEAEEEDLRATNIEGSFSGNQGGLRVIRTTVPTDVILQDIYVPEERPLADWIPFGGPGDHGAFGP